MSREEPRFVVSYVDIDGNHLDQDEFAYIPPAIGHGVELEGGKRYRVVDVWSIYPKRGMLEHGVHAFLEPVPAEDDRPALTFPDYYRKAPASERQD